MSKRPPHPPPDTKNWHQTAEEEAADMEWLRMEETGDAPEGEEEVQSAMEGSAQNPPRQDTTNVQSTSSNPPPSPPPTWAGRRWIGEPPRNAFILFWREKRPLIMEKYPYGSDPADINREVASMWRWLTDNQRAVWLGRLRRRREEYRRAHPDYQFNSAMNGTKQGVADRSSRNTPMAPYSQCNPNGPLTPFQRFSQSISTLMDFNQQGFYPEVVEQDLEARWFLLTIEQRAYYSTTDWEVPEPIEFDEWVAPAPSSNEVQPNSCEPVEQNPDPCERRPRDRAKFRLIQGDANRPNVFLIDERFDEDQHSQEQRSQPQTAQAQTAQPQTDDLDDSIGVADNYFQPEDPQYLYPYERPLSTRSLPGCQGPPLSIALRPGERPDRSGDPYARLTGRATAHSGLLPETRPPLEPLLQTDRENYHEYPLPMEVLRPPRSSRSQPPPERSRTPNILKGYRERQEQSGRQQQQRPACQEEVLLTDCPEGYQNDDYLGRNLMRQEPAGQQPSTSYPRLSTEQYEALRDSIRQPRAQRSSHRAVYSGPPPQQPLYGEPIPLNQRYLRGPSSRSPRQQVRVAASSNRAEGRMDRVQRSREILFGGQPPGGQRPGGRNQSTRPQRHQPTVPMLLPVRVLQSNGSGGSRQPQGPPRQQQLSHYYGDNLRRPPGGPPRDSGQSRQPPARNLKRQYQDEQQRSSIPALMDLDVSPPSSLPQRQPPRPQHPPSRISSRPPPSQPLFSRPPMGVSDSVRGSSSSRQQPARPPNRDPVGNARHPISHDQQSGRKKPTKKSKPSPRRSEERRLSDGSSDRSRSPLSDRSRSPLSDREPVPLARQRRAPEPRAVQQPPLRDLGPDTSEPPQNREEREKWDSEQLKMDRRYGIPGTPAYQSRDCLGSGTPLDELTIRSGPAAPEEGWTPSPGPLSLTLPRQRHISPGEPIPVPDLENDSWSQEDIHNDGAEVDRNTSNNNLSLAQLRPEVLWNAERRPLVDVRPSAAALNGLLLRMPVAPNAPENVEDRENQPPMDNDVPSPRGLPGYLDIPDDVQYLEIDDDLDQILNPRNLQEIQQVQPIDNPPEPQRNLGPQGLFGEEMGVYIAPIVGIDDGLLATPDWRDLLPTFRGFFE